MGVAKIPPPAHLPEYREIGERANTIRAIGHSWTLPELASGLSKMERRNADDLEKLQQQVMIFEADGTVSTRSQAAWGSLGFSGVGYDGQNAGLDMNHAAAVNED